jgi:peptidyl-prolyl cis-trans isomerase A (cyclophilin A)
MVGFALGCSSRQEEPRDVEEPAETEREAAPEKAAPRARENRENRENREAPMQPTGDTPLTNPSAATERAPDQFTAKLETTKGDILVDVTREWAPQGADRFYNLVKVGYYDDVAFFRVVSGFMAQVGIHGNPQVSRAWKMARIPDDPVRQSNTRGMVTFATSGPDSRTSQIFFNFGDNANLDGMGFSPFGRVRDMNVVDALYSGYGEGAPRGRGPAQARIQAEGNPYLRSDFPELDYIRRATIVPR